MHLMERIPYMYLLRDPFRGEEGLQNTTLGHRDVDGHVVWVRSPHLPK